MNPTLDVIPAPTVGASSADPLTVDEIDAHPDCDRIWATIVLLRSEHERLMEERAPAVVICQACQDCIDNEE